MNIRFPNKADTTTWFFVSITTEDAIIGWYPRFFVRLRWKSAEDGRTWLRRPSFGIHRYR